MLTRLTTIAVAHVIAEPHVPAKRHVATAAGYRAVIELLTPRPSCAIAGMDILRIIQGDIV